MTLYGNALRSVRRGARQAAESAVDIERSQDEDWWAAAEAPTGERLAESLRLVPAEDDPDAVTIHLAGAIAAMTLWLIADTDDALWARTHDRAVLMSDDYDERMLASLQLRRASPDPEPQMIARWLAARGGQTYATAGHLARHIGLNRERIDRLGDAWWRIFGEDLLEIVTGDFGASFSAGSGRPTREVTRARQPQIIVARGLARSGHLKKTYLASRLQVSRPTLDAWTS